MRLTHKQLNKFTGIFEIKAKSIIMIDKGEKATIIINGVRIFDVNRELVKEYIKELIHHRRLMSSIYKYYAFEWKQ